MFRKSLAVIAVVATSVAVGLLSLLPVTAQQPEASATRSLNPATVAPGGEVVVTITAANYGSFGDGHRDSARGVHVRIQPQS